MKKSKLFRSIGLLLVTSFVASLLSGCTEDRRTWSYNMFPMPTEMTFDVPQILDYPSGFSTKTEVYDYVMNYEYKKLLYIQDSSFYKTYYEKAYLSYLHLSFDDGIAEDSIVVYVQTFCDGEAALSAELYPMGMPITLYPRVNGWQPDGDTIYDPDSVYHSPYTFVSAQFDYKNDFRLGQRIILLDGHSDLADSSFQGVTILPLRHDSTPPSNNYSMQLVLPKELSYEQY